MIDYSFDLAVVWAFVLAAAIYIYVVLDGFDLGIGLLFGIFPKKGDRDLLMNSVAPVWDGNETWLVLGGGGLFAAFPLAYAVLMPALYPPIIAMLLALIFRGVAFEFRWKATRHRWAWDASFILGSFVATVSQGIILGAILQGVEVEGRAYAGGWWDWLTPFSVLCGAAVTAGYALLGATWLVAKTEGEVRDRARRIAWFAAIAVVVFIVAVSVATPFLRQGYFYRWFGWPQIVLAAPVPLALAGITFLLLRSLVVKVHDYWPFLLSLLLFLMCFGGLGISIWPYIVPTEITIWEAASPYESQLFMFVGAAVLIPIILAYTAFAYWVFRGKLDPNQGYH